MRLRLLHPALALAGTLAVAFACARALQSTEEPLVRQWAWITASLALIQVGAGLLNVILLAPVWMQIVHLLLADLLWIALILLGARTLALAPTEATHQAVTA